MKAIVVIPRKPDSLRLQKIDVPRYSDNEVLLRTINVGIDGTDLEIVRGVYGEAPKGSNYLILGHECLATIEESNAVQNFSEGDLVVPTVRRPDTCPNCQNGESDMCITGDYKEHGIKCLHGFASEYSISDAKFLVKVPKKIKNKQETFLKLTLISLSLTVLSF